MEMLWASLPGRPFPTVLDMAMTFLERVERRKEPNPEPGPDDEASGQARHEPLELM